MANLQLLDTQLSIAASLINQGNGTAAQKLLLPAKEMAQELGLEDRIDSANRNLAISHQVIGNNHYAQGNFEPAQEAYQSAYNAFRTFKLAFKTEEEAAIRMKWIQALLPFWADSNFKIAGKAHNEGNDIVGQSFKDGKYQPDIVLKGLAAWDKAIGAYSKTITIVESAANEEAHIDQGYKTISESKIRELRPAAANWANAIGKPERAMKYLL